MKNKKITISVGIPAFNEQKNIQKLIKAILKQKPGNYVLEAINVVTDGCTDSTVEKVKQIKSKKVFIYPGENRKGKSARLNQLFRLNKSDLLIIVDADIQIKSKSLFNSLAKKIDQQNDSLIGIKAIPLPATGLLEDCINYSMEFQLELRNEWNNNNNYLCYRGAFLAFSKKFIKDISIPNALVNNDSYFYFLAKHIHLKTKYLNNISVYYQSPKTFTDHLHQSSRFQGSKAEIMKYFPEMEHEYSLPKRLLISKIIKYFIKNPILFGLYISILLATKLRKIKSLQSQWKIASSTKILYWSNE